MRPPVASRNGFTLVEALVALALVLFALLTGLSLFWQQPRVERRLAARREAVRIVEMGLEMVRARAVPIAPGPVEVEIPMPFEGPAENLTLWYSSAPTGAPLGLYRVELAATWEVFGDPQRWEVETLVWQR